MLFFLHNLAENQDFSVDFAYPIDQRLASFLQSTSSVECLARGGALKLQYTAVLDLSAICLSFFFLVNLSSDFSVDLLVCICTDMLVF